MESIDRYPPHFDRYSLLDELPNHMIALETVEKRMHKSKVSHLAVPEHPQPSIYTEEVDGFHKRVKRIHDPRKFVVPNAVSEAESPIPPDISLHMGPTLGYLMILCMQ